MQRKFISSEQSGVPVSTPVDTRILAALEGLQFGAVEITVHEGKVVQIERREKFRFSPQASPRT